MLLDNAIVFDQNVCDVDIARNLEREVYEIKHFMNFKKCTNR